VEDGKSLVVMTFFTSLSMAISLGAWFAGFVTTYKGLRGFRRPDLPKLFVPGYDPRAFERWEGSILERVAAALCGTLGVVLVIGLAVGMGRTRQQPGVWIGFVLMMAICLLLVAPLVLWNTRYRAAGEGIATMAIAMISSFALLSAESILILGYLLVPLVALMIWLCVAQLRRANHPWETTGSRVDSPR
jgi:hypothetical protein